MLASASAGLQGDHTASETSFSGPAKPYKHRAPPLPWRVSWLSSEGGSSGAVNKCEARLPGFSLLSDAKEL